MRTLRYCGAQPLWRMEHATCIFIAGMQLFTPDISGMTRSSHSGATSPAGQDDVSTISTPLITALQPMPPRSQSAPCSAAAQNLPWKRRSTRMWRSGCMTDG